MIRTIPSFRCPAEGALDHFVDSFKEGREESFNFFRAQVLNGWCKLAGVLVGALGLWKLPLNVEITRCRMLY